jgi:two-component system NtrC family sensor kinase
MTVARLTQELSEAREHQMAATEVVKIIGRSAFDLDAVLTTLINSAIRLCDATRGVIWLRKGERLFLSAHVNYSDDWVAAVRDSPLTPAADAQTTSGLAAFTGEIVHVQDVPNDPRFRSLAAHKLGDYRAGLAVPLKRDGRVEGVISLSRPEARLFTERQIDLVQTFADQAVIAIANARLFDEVQARSAELSESLKQQTATADVLKAISRSAFALQPILDTLVESATKLCDADKGVIFKRDGDFYRWSANYGHSQETEAFTRANPFVPGRHAVTSRVALEGRAIHVSDVLADPEYGASQHQKLAGYRTILCVPILREGAVAGVFALTRPEVRDFTPKQIELVEIFADQASIAIENVRLFEEVQVRTGELSEALQQQTATADVLKAISRSTFDLQAVLDTLVESATKLCEADKGVIFKRDGDVYRWSANYGNPPELETFARAHPFVPGRYSITSRVALEATTIHVSDVLADPEYGATQFQKLGGFRTILCVPILREGSPVGVFALTRSEVRDFTPRQIELVETFADQAGIAIENVRLFEEVQARTRELTISLQELRTAQDRLIQTEKLASLGQLTAGIAHEIKNPLNFINNFSSLSVELIDELREVLDAASLGGKAREGAHDLTGLLKGNLDKVVQHGRRADSIIKNMLLHSREGSGERRPTSINAVVEESLNLAYHGARAERKDFNITLLRDFDPAAGDVDLYPQEIARVLLNLISNGFYATTKRAAQPNGTYDPVLAAATRNLGDSVEIRIRDNGTGIPPEVKEKMFNPFFTTKPAGEGTGLGLSLSHDIVVKQHAGTIEVNTQPGEFTEFKIVLPRGTASVGGKGGVS